MSELKAVVVERAWGRAKKPIEPHPAASSFAAPSCSVRPSSSQVKAAMHWADGWHVKSEMHDDIQAWLPTRKFEDAVCSILATELKALNEKLKHGGENL
jgi:hypothetical protein